MTNALPRGKGPGRPPGTWNGLSAPRHGFDGEVLRGGGGRVKAGWDRLKRIPPWADLVLVTLIAAVPRLASLEFVPFDHNQGSLLRVVQPIVDKGEWPLVGWEISGLFHGKMPALLFWILALPRFYTESPTFLVGFGAFFDVLAAPLMCLLGRVLAGRRFGLLAATLYALDANLVANSRILWNVTPCPFFTVLLFFGLARLLMKRESTFAILVLFALSSLVQIHQVTVYFLPVIAVLLVLFRPRVRLHHLLAGILAAALLASPYLYHEIVHGFPNLGAARTIASTAFSESTSTSNRAAIREALTYYRFALPTSRLPVGVHPPVPVRVFEISEDAKRLLFCAGVVLLALSVARGAWRVLRRKEAGRWPAVAAFLLAWYYIPLAVLDRAGLAVQERYLLFLVPAALFAMVAPIEAFLVWTPAAAWGRVLRRVLVAVTAGLLAFATAGQEVVRWSTRDFTRTHGLVRGQFCLGESLDISRFFIEELGMDHSDFQRRAFFFQWPEREVLEQGEGYEFLFRYLLNEGGARLGAQSPQELSYLVFNGHEGRNILELLSTRRVFDKGSFVVAEMDSMIRGRTVRVTAAGDEGGSRADRARHAWSVFPMPVLVGDRLRRRIHGTDRVEGAGPWPLHLDSTITGKETGEEAWLMLKTRSCPQAVYLNGETVGERTCSPEPPAVELPRTLFVYPLRDRIKAGENALRIRLVPRYRWDRVEMLALRSRGGDLVWSRPPDEAIYEGFLTSDTREVPFANVSPPFPGAAPVERGAAMAEPAYRLHVSEDGSAGDLGAAESVWGAGAWRIDYRFTTRGSWLFVLYRNDPAGDWRGYGGLGVAVKGDGYGGILRVVLKEGDGDEWGHANRLALWKNEWTALRIPFDALVRDPVASTGDGHMDLSAITDLMIQVIPGRGSVLRRESTLLVGQPHLVPGEAP